MCAASPFVCAICTDNRIWRYIDGRVHAHRHPRSRLCVSAHTLSIRTHSFAHSQTASRVELNCLGSRKWRTVSKKNSARRAARAPSPFDDAEGPASTVGSPWGVRAPPDAVILLIIHIRTLTQSIQLCMSHNKTAGCCGDDKVETSMETSFLALRLEEFLVLCPPMLNYLWVCLLECNNENYMATLYQGSKM